MVKRLEAAMWAFYGAAGIPAAWLDRLCMRDLIEETAGRLAAGA